MSFLLIHKVFDKIKIHLKSYCSVYIFRCMFYVYIVLFCWYSNVMVILLQKLISRKRSLIIQKSFQEIIPLPFILFNSLWANVCNVPKCITTQKMNFSIKDFFSKYDQICRKLCSVCCVNNTLLVLIMMITIYLIVAYTYLLNISSDLTIDITYYPGFLLIYLRTSLQIYNLIIKMDKQ